jgi:hypothetical protein
MVTTLGLLRRADRGQTLEIGASDVVEPHRRLPLPYLGDRGRQAQYRIVEGGPRPVSGVPAGYQLHRARDFFARADPHVAYLSVTRNSGLALGQRVLSLDFAPSAGQP